MIYYPEDENPNAATEEATTHESNAVVNNEGGTSETPSNLVGFNFKPGEVVTQEELDRILSYNKDSLGESKLTPNPAGFGFTRQEFVDSLPLAINARPNTLYCLKVKNDNILVGYKLYKFVLTPEGGEFRPFGATPDLDIEDGGQSTPRNEVNEPRTAFEKVFNGNVGFNGDIFYKGKLLHIDEIDDKGFDILTLTGESGTLSEEDYNLAASNQCAILVAPVYLYKDRNASTLLLYKSLPFVSNNKTYYLEVEITKADKSYVLRQVELPSVSEIDADVTVEIENDYTNDNYAERTNYATPITLAEFIANCEAGNVYTNDGIIAKINNLLDEHTFRVILIGRNHEVLAYDDTTQAKTTWQFLDMPEHQVRLGLPFNVIDWGSNMGRAYANAYLDGTNADALTWYPSNRGGLITAQGLLNCLHTIFEGLPLSLKRAIKTVRKDFAIPRQYRSIAASGGTETDSGTTGYLAQKLFHLTATELGSTSYGTEGTAYSYLNSNARRIRYYNNSAAGYWAATPHPSLSYYWVIVSVGGNISTRDTYYGYGVAPAFCI